MHADEAMGGVPVPNGCADVALVPSKMLMMPAWAAASAAACAICRWAYICPPSIANPSAPISRMLIATTTRMTACPSSAAESNGGAFQNTMIPCEALPRRNVFEKYVVNGS